MAYATLVHVERLHAARTFSDRSMPTKDDVAGFLEDCAVELDAALAAREYEVPVPTTATSAFRLVQRWNAAGAHALAEEAAPDSPKAEGARKEWERILKRIEDGKIDLPELAHDEETSGIRTLAPATPMFTRDMEF